MPRRILSRRGAIATVIGAGAAWLGGRAAFLVARRGGTRSTLGSDPCAAIRAEPGYPGTIGEACLNTLLAGETSEGSLTRTILRDMRAAGMDVSSGMLAHAIRERSRNDFRDGRIVNVDGWMLSLTETRLYALAALRARPPAAIE